MYRRVLYEALEDHLDRKLITVVTGMRRVGKTTAVKYLLEKVAHDNKAYIDFEKIEHRHIFMQSSYKEVQIELEIMGIDFNKPAVIALDEVQLVGASTSIIKYFYDHFDIKFIVTGSSSFYLKDQFSESLAGRKRIFEMFPLNFQEYLHFREEDTRLIRQFAMSPYRSSLYLKYKEAYEDYLRFGGFPEVVLSDSEEEKEAYLKDVINAYIELDIKLLSDFEASHDLYQLIRLLAGRVGSPLEVSRLASILGINRNKVKSYLELLQRTYFVIVLPPFTKKLSREIRLRSKLYLADTGLLQQLAQTSSGQVFENAIAAQLFPLGDLRYYQRKSGQEIDFILNGEQAFEAKETPTPFDHQRLEKRARQLELTDCALIGRYPPQGGFTDFIWGGVVG